MDNPGTWPDVWSFSQHCLSKASGYCIILDSKNKKEREYERRKEKGWKGMSFSDLTLTCTHFFGFSGPWKSPPMSLISEMQ
jgi:hypothetical protein